jgi:hypothetical protein
VALKREIVEGVGDLENKVHISPLLKTTDKLDIREYIDSIPLDHRLFVGAGQYCLTHRNTEECRSLEKVRIAAKGS